MNEDRRTDRDPALDRRFGERVSEHYQPKPFAPAERARFDAQLHDRVGRSQRAPIWVPATAIVTAALALFWWMSPVTAPLPQSEEAPPETASRWEAEVLLVDANVVLLEEEYLPDDYEAIALAFLDGV